MAYHYVYKIFFETGHVYYGVRSCECPPGEDPYLGSPQAYKDYWTKYEPTKTIVDTFDTREEANLFETFCIGLQWYKTKESRSLSLNGTIGGIKFCVQGIKQTEEHKTKIAEKLARPYYLISPEGEVFEGVNLCEFCRKMQLNQRNMVRVVVNKKFHCCGWTASLEAHKLYIHCYENRGIGFSNNIQKWVVSSSINKKYKPKYFKVKRDAFNYRDKLELEGYKFTIKCINWKEKLQAV